MPWYLGKPGALVQLPAPSRGTQVPFSGGGATHQLLSGGQVVDKFPAKRSWQFSWQALTREQVGVLDAFVFGAVGPGPYVLLDPEQRNLLTPNVSSGTSALGTTDGFTIGAASALRSTGNFYDHWNSLGGPFPAGTFNTLAADIPTGTADLSIVYEVTARIPVVPLQTYTYSVYFAPDSGSVFGAYAQIDWYDLASTLLGTSSGAIVATNTNARSTVSAAAPSTAATARLTVQITPAASSGATHVLYADGFQFEQSSAVTPWVPGVGVPYVSVASGGGRGRQQTNQNDYSLTLVEL